MKAVPTIQPAAVQAPTTTPRRSRFVRPEVVVLPISGGDTITVRKRLTAGEQRAMFARTYFASLSGEVRTNPFEVGLSTVLAFLVDWTLVDDGGELVEIKDKSATEIADALNALDPDDFAEIKAAIEAHEDAMDKERALEKKSRDGVTPSSATSPSPDATAGATSGSASSTETSTASSSKT